MKWVANFCINTIMQNSSRKTDVASVWSSENCNFSSSILPTWLLSIYLVLIRQKACTNLLWSLKSAFNFITLLAWWMVCCNQCKDFHWLYWPLHQFLSLNAVCFSNAALWWAQLVFLSWLNYHSVREFRNSLSVFSELIVGFRTNMFFFNNVFCY